VGPGAKAGGPNYVKQLGSWHHESNVQDDQWLSAAGASDERWWSDEFAVEQDPTSLFCEANRFGYRPLRRVGVRVGADRSQVEVDRVLAAAARCGVPVLLSRASEETEEEFGARLASLDLERVRVVGHVGETLRTAAARARVHLADEPITRSGRIELLHYLREQSVSQTLHRFGNLVAVG
jgi:RHH-type proline utilization regulon transcriptional repressor/proline dehydrogenase/delta 1-pyrroline-5-carboxylate dehydrogenase